MRPVSAGKSLLIGLDEGRETGDVCIAVAGRHRVADWQQPASGNA